MTDLPINIEFAAAYLDGALEDEHPEIRRMWTNVRRHLGEMATRLAELERLTQPTPQPPETPAGTSQTPEDRS